MSRCFEEKDKGRIVFDMSVCICGVRIDRVTREEAVERALAPMDEPSFVVTPNAIMLDACRRDPSLASLLNRSALSLADGAGVLWAARRQDTPLECRVAGIEFGEALLERAAKEGLRVFLLGGGEGVATAAAERLCERMPSLQICGTYWGYFERGGEEERRLLSIIRSTHPDILFVCLGFPLQERWIVEHLDFLRDLRVIAGLGGSLDVWSGNLRRAPRIVSRCGMEWAWRMLRQPSRLRGLPAIFRCCFLWGLFEKRPHTPKAFPKEK